MIFSTKAYAINIDTATKEERAQSDDYKNYVENLLTSIVNHRSAGYYNANSLTTEVINAAIMAVTAIKIGLTDIDEALNKQYEIISQRFLKCECATQDSVDRLKVKIKMGCLFQAIITDDNNDDKYQYLISKLDSTDFLNEESMKHEKGITIGEKNLGKSCLIDICFIADIPQIQSIKILSDTGAKYFYTDFLEVNPIFQDDANTENLVKEIKKIIDKNLKTCYPRERLIIKNSFIHYMRQTDFIDYDKMVESIFTTYLKNPVTNIDDNVKNKIADDLSNLPSKNKFSTQFNRITEKITSRIIKDVYNLTSDIDLILKNKDSEDILEQISAIEDADGKHYLRIYTENAESIEAFRQ